MQNQKLRENQEAKLKLLSSVKQSQRATILCHTITQNIQDKLSAGSICIKKKIRQLMNAKQSVMQMLNAWHLNMELPTVELQALMNLVTANLNQLVLIRWTLVV
jgi:hypothetical protein